MKKEYDVFIQELIREVEALLGKGYHVMRSDYVNPNGGTRRMIAISDSLYGTAPCICMDAYYEMYQRPGDIPLAAADVVKAYHSQAQEAFDLSRVAEWGWAQGRVLFRLVDTGWNRELLEQAPHKDIPKLGLSMVIYFPVQQVKAPGEGQAAVRVLYSLLEAWGVTEEELIGQALRNTQQQLPAKAYSIREMIQGSLEGEGRPSDGQDVCGRLPMYVLTNEQKLYGAGCMLYEGVLEREAERLGADLYILPSLVHEVMLFPALPDERGALDELRNMVAGINRSDALLARDVLSDQVFYYDRKKRKLTVAV